MKEESPFWNALCWIVKFITKIFLWCAYGFLRIVEIIFGQIAKWLKDIIS